MFGGLAETTALAPLVALNEGIMGRVRPRASEFGHHDRPFQRHPAGSTPSPHGPRSVGGALEKMAWMLRARARPSAGAGPARSRPARASSLSLLRRLPLAEPVQEPAQIARHVPERLLAVLLTVAAKDA